MWKKKMRLLWDYMIRHSKAAFPVVVIVAVAFTVVLALNAGNGNVIIAEGLPDSTAAEEKSTEESIPEEAPDVPLELAADPALRQLVSAYYNALAQGDVETVQSVSNYLEDTEKIRIQELSRYIESYPLVEVYTKPGPEKASVIAYVYTKVKFDGYEELVPGLQAFYVCAKEGGELYFNKGEVKDDILEYIQKVNFQDDVVELHNRVNAECNELYLNNTELFDYVYELEREVSKATGETLAAQILQEEGGEESASQEPEPGEESVEVSAEAMAGEQAAWLSAQTTTTVNVRSSDSEKAEKVGKVSGGTKVQVLEQRLNGWSKVSCQADGKTVEGYIKSEYLQVAGNAGGEAIGTVTAISNVNMREGAEESARKIAVVAGGDTVELLARENGWCRVRYNGQVGYVKEDYVR
ncbi:MAG: SH3 domain-containing protein [Clostridium sp.]|jgi:uncharacterized protein YraI|nr:SH3 domain-containing protein [Clostridium sp.]